MADVHTRKQRSTNMAAIRGKHTKPEMTVRQVTHHLGYRYVLHKKDLPGKPDLVFPSRRKIIFVHGCFWHRCPKCKFPLPKNNREFWKKKFGRNRARDKRKTRVLEQSGWEVAEIWECDLVHMSAERIVRPVLRMLAKAI